MNTSLKLDKKNVNQKGEYLIYIRLRGKSLSGGYSESSISTGIYLSSKHFSKGGISPRTPNYTNKQRIITQILDDELKKVIHGNNSEDVKKEYFDNLMKDTFVEYHGERQELYKNVMNKTVFPMLVDFMYKEVVKQVGK